MFTVIELVKHHFVEQLLSYDWFYWSWIWLIDYSNDKQWLCCKVLSCYVCIYCLQFCFSFPLQMTYSSYSSGMLLMSKGQQKQWRGAYFVIFFFMMLSKLMIISVVNNLVNNLTLNPYCSSGRVSSASFCKCCSIIWVKTFPITLSRDIPLMLLQSPLSLLFLYKKKFLWCY